METCHPNFACTRGKCVVTRVPEVAGVVGRCIRRACTDGEYPPGSYAAFWGHHCPLRLRQYTSQVPNILSNFAPQKLIGMGFQRQKICMHGSNSNFRTARPRQS